MFGPKSNISETTPSLTNHNVVRGHRTFWRIFSLIKHYWA